jgi:hypothetical protein
VTGSLTGPEWPEAGSRFPRAVSPELPEGVGGEVAERPLRSEDQTVTSSPANRTAWREEENRSLPASQQVIASAVTGPTPYSRAASTLAPTRCPGGVGQLVPHRVQPGVQGLGHLQGGGDLQLPGWGQVSGRGGPQRGQAPLAAQRTLAQGRGAVVEQDRVDALRPGGVLATQIAVGLHQRPAFQDAAGRDPALRQPTLGQ